MFSSPGLAEMELVARESRLGGGAASLFPVHSSSYPGRGYDTLSSFINSLRPWEKSAWSNFIFHLLSADSVQQEKSPGGILTQYDQDDQIHSASLK